MSVLLSFIFIVVLLSGSEHTWEVFHLTSESALSAVSSLLFLSNLDTNSVRMFSRLLKSTFIDDDFRAFHVSWLH